MNGFRKVAIGISLIAAGTAAQAAATVSAFTSSAGLDMQGSFAYAVTMNYNAAGVTVGDATFSYALGGNTPGASVSHQYYIQNWHPSNYGASANDVALGQVMQSIAWSGGSYGSEVLSLSLSNLQVGQTYKAQLLFGEACCDRGFDVFQDGVKIADDVSPFGISGNNYFGSAVLTNVFTATASTVTFGFGGYGGHPDYNPIINAATLENVSIAAPVPEPETYGMMLAGLGLLGFMRRRRARQAQAL